MKKTALVVTVASILAAITSCNTMQHVESVNTRDYEYEAYCDSVWEADPDYYMDVVVESDEYQEYIEINGRWWE